MTKYSRDYLNFNLWIDFYYQYEYIKRSGANTVLEIGKGTGILETILENFGYIVTTADIDESTKPDLLSDIRELKFEASSYDAVCGFEVLEHVPFGDFSKALCEMSRVSRKYVIISLPYASVYFSAAFMPVQALILEKFYRFFGINLFSPLKINISIPLFFLGKKLMHKEHYWEMGRKGYSVKTVENVIKNSGLKIVKKESRVLFPYHVFYFLEKI